MNKEVLFYIVIFVIAASISYLEYRRDKKEKKRNLIILALSILAALLSIIDLYFTSSSLTSIEKLSNLNIEIGKNITKLNSLNIDLTKNIQKGIDRNINLSDTIININNNIEKLVTSNLNLGNEINNIITGGNSYPRLLFKSAYASGTLRQIIIENVGKYPLHGLSVDIYDRTRVIAGPTDHNSIHFDIDELANKKLLDSIYLNHDWNYYPVQKFDVVISSINGYYREHFCFMFKENIVNQIHWLFRCRGKDLTIIDTLDRPDPYELERFLHFGHKIQELQN